MLLPTPNELGLPPKFDRWRDSQDEACAQQLAPTPRFLLQVCPTGFGKSAVYMASSTFYGRTVILTSTKGLQAQLLAEFGSMVVDIRGKGNYQCRLNTKVSCDHGMCSFGVRCRMKDEGGCFYYDQLRKAKAAKVVVTNYSYWMTQNEYGEGLGRFDLLVLDEAHSAPDQVINHVSVSFSKRSKYTRVLGLDDSLPVTLDGWIDWAHDRKRDVEGDMEQAKMQRKERRFIELKNIKSKLERITENMNEGWIWEDGKDDLVLTPKWPAPFAETVLFLGIPKVIFTSATVVPKTIHLLGVTEGYQHEEFKHNFPVENRRLIHLPTVRMNHRIGEVEERQWLTKVDAIIRSRLGTSGIIHTVSYARRDLILARSKFANRMITHNKLDTESVVRKFKSMPPGTILVSPSMTTGWDFPYDECRWQIIVKLPFPDTRGEIIKSRAKDDDDYLAYLVMQQLIQATGRGVRAEDDWCDTYLLDNNIVWFIEKYKHLCVNWFKGAYKVSQTIPPRR